MYSRVISCGANYLCWDTQLISTTVNPCYCTCTTFSVKLLCLFRSTLIHAAHLDPGRRTTEHCAGLQRHALEFLVEVKENALMPQMPKLIFECNKLFTTHFGSADVLSFLFQSAWIYLYWQKVLVSVRDAACSEYLGYRNQLFPYFKTENFFHLHLSICLSLKILGWSFISTICLKFGKIAPQIVALLVYVKGLILWKQTNGWAVIVRIKANNLCPLDLWYSCFDTATKCMQKYAKRISPCTK